jgi:hypothetical protein
MRILVAIPHYFDPGVGDVGDGRRHGSRGGDPRPRVAALAACVAAWHQLFGPAQRVIDHTTRVARPANAPLVGPVDVVLCTTGDRHLLPGLPLPAGSFRHHPAVCEPLLLGFECRAILRDHLGRYDYFCFMEDDLICRDPWLFAKLAWFTGQLGDGALLQPNRYEVGPLGLVHKAYIDGDITERATSAYQDLAESPVVTFRLLGQQVAFHRPLNPHSGCFFLNAAQMRRWADRPDFLDRDTGFIGPLESAATLGVLKNFRIYKPAPENASFLEIEHHGTGFLSQLRRRESGAAEVPDA